MKPDKRFVAKGHEFWACVRSLSQELKYSDKETGRVKSRTIEEMQKAFVSLGLNERSLANGKKPTNLGIDLTEYFQYRADLLNEDAKCNLMDVDDAKKLFEEYRAKINPPGYLLAKNKQIGEKSGYSYLTCLVNMLIYGSSGSSNCDYNPQKLTTITKNFAPLRTLARRVDGAFPSSINPVAIWEIKEYYHTTSFGSRIADGVYESLLDGLELEEVRASTGVDVKHYLMIDSHRTWWLKGKPYLCRIVDMLNMGYVDEVLVGKEAIAELPRLVDEWLKLIEMQQDRGIADPAAQA